MTEILKKAAITAPQPRQEIVDVAELGGAVIVRALPLSQRLELGRISSERPDSYIAELLARCVLDGDGEPIFDAGEWDHFSGANQDAAFALHRAAQRVAGLGDEPGKE